MITQFYEDRLAEFNKRMIVKDRLNLMNCYGFGNFRILTNIYRMLGSPTKINSFFDPQKKDQEIVEQLVFERKLPEEIHAYLCMQFFDILSKIPQNSRTINKEQYQYLTDRYVCEYEYNKVLHIVHQNFDEVV